MTDLLTVYAPIGGGHKAAALALTEVARSAGLEAETCDVFDVGPHIVGSAILSWHLNTTARTPNLYGSAYYGSNSRGGRLEPLRLKFDGWMFRKLLREVQR